MSIWRRILIDRIGIAVQLSGADLYEHVRGQMYWMRDEQKQILPTGKIKLTANKYSLRLDYYPAYTWKKSGRRKIADLVVGSYKMPGKKALNRYVTLTLYPSQFRGEEFAEFKSTFNLLFDPITYPSLYKTGMVNYLELAVDSLSYQSHGFLPYRKYCSGSSIYKGKDGCLGTTYIGSVSSDLRFRVYDKYQQLLDTGKPTFTKVLPHTRIEAVMRRLGITPAKICEIKKNPFKSLLIANLELSMSVSADKEWQVFIGECLSDGVPKALAKRPKHIRKKYLALLDSRAASWWKPDTLWKGLSEAAAEIAP